MVYGTGVSRTKTDGFMILNKPRRMWFSDSEFVQSQRDKLSKSGILWSRSTENHIYPFKSSHSYLTARVLNATQDLGLKISTQIGTFVGQLLFGWLADIYGRKRMCESIAEAVLICGGAWPIYFLDGVELIIMITATFAQALTAGNQAVSIVGALIVWRFIMGVGVGGDYPLSAVIASEFASKRNRGRLMTAVFANQGWGQLSRHSPVRAWCIFDHIYLIASSLVALVIVRGYRDTLRNAGTNPIVGVNAVDYMWRLFIGLGCVPAAIALYFRLTITETPRFTMDIRRNVRQANMDIDSFLTPNSSTVDAPSTIQRVQPPRPSRRDFIRHFSHWSNMKVLIGTAYSWFALDVSGGHDITNLWLLTLRNITDSILWSEFEYQHHSAGDQLQRYWKPNSPDWRSRCLSKSSQHFCG